MERLKPYTVPQGRELTTPIGLLLRRITVARELSSGWGGGAQLTFASVVHDRKKT